MSKLVHVLTGNDYVRVSRLNGRGKHYRAALEITDQVRMSKRTFAKAEEAKIYKRFVLIRLKRLRLARNYVEIASRLLPPIEIPEPEQDPEKETENA